MSNSKDSSDSTQPYSRGHFEQLQRTLQLESVSPLEVENPRQARPLISTLFEVENPAVKNRIRLLIQPRNPNKFVSSPKHQHQEQPITCTDTIQYLALTQGHEDTSYEIMQPLKCELFYDPSADSITFINMEMSATIVRPVIDGAISTKDFVPSDISTRAEPGEAVLIQPFALYRFEPGAWAVSSLDSDCGAPEFQFQVYRRPYFLQVIGTTSNDASTDATGTKRRHHDEDDGENNENDQGAAPSVVSLHDSSLIRRINDLMDVRGGDVVRVTSRVANSIEEYQVSRVGDTRKSTNMSTVYQGKVTSHGNEVVVVKLIKGRDAADSAKKWTKRVSAASAAIRDVIAPLLGGDARLSALYIRWFNAQDLSQKYWRHPDSYYFRGSSSDATRVLSDMSRALEYLSEHRITHHDIKPANILYRNDGELDGGAVLIDFGLSSQEGAQGDGKYKGRRHHGGTPWYIGPEFLPGAGTGASEPAASEDVWALGIVLLYLLGLIPLPESGKQVGEWRIDAALSNPSSNANRSMKRWLDITGRAIERGLKSEMRNGGGGGGLYSIVDRMLEQIPVVRITPSGIRDALADIKRRSRVRPV